MPGMSMLGSISSSRPNAAPFAARLRTESAGASGWICIHDLDQPALEHSLAERE